MSFIGEIKLFAGDFAPRGWLFCQGQILAVSTYAELFSLIGSRYGGNGTETFALPDLRGRAPIGTGEGPGLSSRLLSQFGGQQEVTLHQTQIPAHNHSITNTPQVENNLTVTGSGTMKCASNVGNSDDPSGAYPAKTKAVGGDNIYTTDGAQATDTMNSSALDISANLQGDIGVTVNSVCGMTGAGLAHENMQPWLCLNYIIKFDGVYPQRN